MTITPIENEKMLTLFTNMGEFYPHNKMLDLASSTSSRMPSPQSAQFSFRSSSGSGDRRKAARTSTIGYIAPKFDGKKAQMAEG
jgi:hypothetical protein